MNRDEQIRQFAERAAARTKTGFGLDPVTIAILIQLVTAGIQALVKCIQDRQKEPAELIAQRPRIARFVLRQEARKLFHDGDDYHEFGVPAVDAIIDEATADPEPVNAVCKEDES